MQQILMVQMLYKEKNKIIIEKLILIFYKPEINDPKATAILATNIITAQHVK
jgi:hypothetical protein